MHARVVTVTVHRDKIDECIRIMRESIAPEAKKQKGFHDLLLLTDRATGKSIVFSLWENEADLNASETSGYYNHQLAKLQPLFAAPPTREICTVGIQDLSGLKGGTLYGRVVTPLYQHGKADEGTRITRDSILPDAKKQKGYEGFLTVADANAGKGYSMSIWASEADRTASETGGYLGSAIAKVQHLLMGAPTRENFEVTAVTLAAAHVPMEAQHHPPTP